MRFPALKKEVLFFSIFMFKNVYESIMDK